MQHLKLFEMNELALAADWLLSVINWDGLWCALMQVSWHGKIRALKSNGLIVPLQVAMQVNKNFKARISKFCTSKTHISMFLFNFSRNFRFWRLFEHFQLRAFTDHIIRINIVTLVITTQFDSFYFFRKTIKIFKMKINRKKSNFPIKKVGLLKVCVLRL